MSDVPSKARMIELHRQLWDWKAAKESLTQMYWPGMEDAAREVGRERPGYGYIVKHDCFACEYAERMLIDLMDRGDLSGEEIEGWNYCKYCPLEWPGEAANPQRREYFCEHDTGLHSGWLGALRKKDYEAMMNIAAKIRDLPECINIRM